MANLVPTMVQVHIARVSAVHGWEFLILHRSEHVHLYPGMWQCVTGRTQSEERAIGSVVREVQEETSLRPSRLWILPHVASWYSAQNDTIEHTPCFGMLVESDAAVALSTEHDACVWLPLPEASDKLLIPSQRLTARLFADMLITKLHDRQWNMVYEITDW
jgi:8-oxo-dGTP pyrophosphatase MutT (NUDIX family)